MRGEGAESFDGFGEDQLRGILAHIQKRRAACVKELEAIVSELEKLPSRASGGMNAVLPVALTNITRIAEVEREFRTLHEQHGHVRAGVLRQTHRRYTGSFDYNRSVRAPAHNMEAAITLRFELARQKAHALTGKVPDAFPTQKPKYLQ
jgi:hypothetical protein